MWPRAADEFTVYKKGGTIRPYPISDRKRYLFQLLTDPDRVRQFTVMRRSLSTAIERCFVATRRLASLKRRTAH